MKTTLRLLTFAFSSSFLLSNWAAAAGDQVSAASAASPTLSRGEIKKVDPEQGKITIKHGPIENLDMPGMTMVFRMQLPAQIGTLTAGDLVLFRAEKASGGFVVTEVKKAE